VTHLNGVDHGAFGLVFQGYSLGRPRTAQNDVLHSTRWAHCVHRFDHSLPEEAFWLALSPDDALCQKAAVGLDDLTGKAMLLLEEGHCLRGQALDVCYNAGGGAAIEHGCFRFTSLETLRHMVAEGVGMTLL